MPDLRRLRDFVVGMSRIVAGSRGSEAVELVSARPLLARLVAHDDWLPDEYAVPGPEFSRIYLLHADPLGRFCVVSFVLGPGHRSPVHDYRVWSLAGVLRGAEISSTYKAADGALIAGAQARLERGQVVAVSPIPGRAEAIANADDERVLVSIRVYGGNIGVMRRTAFDIASGAQKPFVSGYANASLPNLWNFGTAA